MPTKIEWCDETINPVTGCTPISEGCERCYAANMAKRFWGERKFSDIRFHPGVLGKIATWRKPRKVFIGSMGDIFHDDVDWNWQYKIIEMIAHYNIHTFMILTKRPHIMAKRMREIKFHLDRNYGELIWPLPNLWLGVTVENNDRRDRIETLLKIPAAVRFVSVEPMLGPVDIGGFIRDYYHVADGREAYRQFGLNWVICGAETGPGARPMQPDWAASLYNQCKDSGTPFFFKKDSKQYPIIDEIKNTRELPKIETAHQ